MLMSVTGCTQDKVSNNNAKEMKKVIYVMDPHCGWCYGNSPNIVKLEKELKDDYQFELLVGGMWIGENAPKGGEGFSTFISNHSPQMERITGAYIDPLFFKLTQNPSYVFSSLEPSCAIVLIKELDYSKTIDFAKAVQKAIFAEGKQLDKIETYLPILESLKIDTEAFKANWMSVENLTKTKGEFLRADKLANGFPTLLIENNNQIDVITSGYFDYDKVYTTLTQNN